MLDLAASTLLFIGYVVLLQVGKNSTVTSAGYSTQETCPSGALEQVYTSWPPCRPRKILVKLPIPDDSDVIEVIPSMAEVTRCGGVCHEGNLYHKCVPKIGARRQKNVMAVFRKRGDEMTCSNIEIEEHTDCKCGCDIEASNCTPQQTYDHYYCKCRCTNLEDRRMCLLDRGRKVWDESQCRCLCRLEEYRECSTGFVYDPVETCRCIRLSSRSNDAFELTTNLAGIEIVAPLCLILIIFIISTVVLAWKLRQALTKGSGSDKNEAETPETVLELQLLETNESRQD